MVNLFLIQLVCACRHVNVLYCVADGTSIMFHQLVDLGPERFREWRDLSMKSKPIILRFQTMKI